MKHKGTILLALPILLAVILGCSGTTSTETNDSNSQTTNTGVPSGEWVSNTDFGTLTLTVANDGMKINKIKFEFNGWKCGRKVNSGTSETTSEWKIDNGSFKIMRFIGSDQSQSMTITGTYDENNNMLKGDWESISTGTKCTGTWEAKQ
jgi:hypothetical protein